MIVVIAILLGSTAVLLALSCSKGSPASSAKQAAPPVVKHSPQLAATNAPKDSTMIASATPEAESPPQKSAQNTGGLIDSTTPLESGGHTSGGLKGASPNGTGTGGHTGTGTTPGAENNGGTGTTPQSSQKKRDKSKRTVEMEPSEGDLLIQTLTTGPDSLMERGYTTKTREPDASNYQKGGGRKRKKNKRPLSLATAKTLESPLKKTHKEKEKEKEKKEKEKEKKEAVMTTSSSALCENDEDYKERTGQDPTDERGKRVNSPVREKEETKTKEGRTVEGRTVEGRTVEGRTHIDPTQYSNTRREHHK